MVAVANSRNSTPIGPESPPQRSQAPARSTGDYFKWLQVPVAWGGQAPAIGELLVNGRKLTVAEHVDEGGMRYVCLACGIREWIVSQDADGDWFASNDDEFRTMARAVEAAYRWLADHPQEQPSY